MNVNRIQLFVPGNREVEKNDKKERVPDPQRHEQQQQQQQQQPQPTHRQEKATSIAQINGSHLKF